VVVTTSVDGLPDLSVVRLGLEVTSAGVCCPASEKGLNDLIYTYGMRCGGSLPSSNEEGEASLEPKPVWWFLVFVSYFQAG
jgi:hypothetical protein